MKIANRSQSLIILSACIMIFFAGCGHSSTDNTDNQKQQIVTVAMQAVTQTLYFSGHIKPLTIMNVTSPVEGVVTKRNFTYGQSVKAEQELLAINSSKLHEDYQSALVQYLKAKSSYFTAKQKFGGTQELMQHELISRESYNDEKQRLASTEFDYLQSSYKLQKILKTKKTLSESLSLSRVTEAADALKKPFNEQYIVAPAAGIVLMPIKTGDSSGNNESTSLELGSQVKMGQALLTIGDLSGIAMDIQVPELNIADIKLGQKVIITGSAFPGKITAKVSTIGAQATSSTSSSESLPSFTVSITATQLTEQQHHLIHAGMSAKVALELPQPAAILVPIAAVFEKKNQTYVNVQKDNKETETRAVSTGKTTENQVIITTGLKAGEKVIVPTSSDKPKS